MVGQRSSASVSVHADLVSECIEQAETLQCNLLKVGINRKWWN